MVAVALLGLLRQILPRKSPLASDGFLVQTPQVPRKGPPSSVNLPLLAPTYPLTCQLSSKVVPTCLPRRFCIEFVSLRTLIFAIPYGVFHGSSIFQQIASKTLPKLQNTFKITPKRTKLPQKCSQDAPKSLPRASPEPPKRPQERSKTPQDASSNPQDQPNDSQKSPKMFQETSKRLPRASQEAPKGLQEPCQGSKRFPNASQDTSQAPNLSLSSTI